MSGKRLIKRALKAIAAEQTVQAEQFRKQTQPGRPNYGGGLSSEGYVGGYRDALSDVLLAMNGVTPDRRGWWEKRHNDIEDEL